MASLPHSSLLVDEFTQVLFGVPPVSDNRLAGKLLAETTHANEIEDAVIYFPCDPLESGDLRGIRGE